MDANIDLTKYHPPAIFRAIQTAANASPDEMLRTFNMGIGLTLVVSPYYAESIQHQLTAAGHENWIIGRVEQGPKSVTWAK